MKIYFNILIISIFFLGSCNLTGNRGNNSGKNAGEKGIRIVREYYNDGKLKSEISMKDNTKHGITRKYNKQNKMISSVNYADNKKEGVATNYYPSGKVHSTITYMQDRKNGQEVWYYENGRPFRENPFVDDKINGMQKFYYENGKIKAEVPFKNNFPGIGLKEYTEEGILMKKYPAIKIDEINHIALADKFILNISLTNSARRVKFYIGKLDEGKYMNDNLYEILNRGGVATLTYDVPLGYVKMETINIVAKYTTRAGVPYITQKSYNLALKH